MRYPFKFVPGDHVELAPNINIFAYGEGHHTDHGVVWDLMYLRHGPSLEVQWVDDWDNWADGQVEWVGIPRELQLHRDGGFVELSVGRRRSTFRPTIQLGGWDASPPPSTLASVHFEQDQPRFPKKLRLQTDPNDPSRPLPENKTLNWLVFEVNGVRYMV